MYIKAVEDVKKWQCVDLCRICRGYSAVQRFLSHVLYQSSNYFGEMKIFKIAGDSPADHQNGKSAQNWVCTVLGHHVLLTVELLVHSWRHLRYRINIVEHMHRLGIWYRLESWYCATAGHGSTMTTLYRILWRKMQRRCDGGGCRAASKDGV